MTDKERKKKERTTARGLSALLGPTSSGFCGDSAGFWTSVSIRVVNWLWWSVVNWLWCGVVTTQDGAVSELRNHIPASITVICQWWISRVLSSAFLSLVLVVEKEKFAQSIRMMPWWRD